MLASVWEDLCRGQWNRFDHAGIEWEPAGRDWGGRDPADGEWDVVSVSSDRLGLMEDFLEDRP